MTRALLVVDVQNDFCEGGSLAVGGGADVAAAISVHMASAADRYAQVVGTRDWHVDPGAHFSTEPDYRDSWPPHCVANSHGAEFHPALDVDRLDAVFSKGRHEAAYSGFEGATSDGTSLKDWLHKHHVDDITIVGLATDYCVRATALDGVRNGFTTHVFADLTAGVADETAEAALVELSAAGVYVSDS